MESQLSDPPQSPAPTIHPLSSSLFEADMDRWNEAYERVETYFISLRLRNRILLSQLVQRSIDAAMERTKEDPLLEPLDAAMQEAAHIVDTWVHGLLGDGEAEEAHHLPTRGRLAMLLADMPGRYQEHFLRQLEDGSPEALSQAMKESYLAAGPDLEVSPMKPRPIDLGPMNSAVRMLERPRFLLAIFLAIALVSWLVLGFFG